MIELLIGTTNQGKFAEVQAFLQKLPLEIFSLASLGNWPLIVEDGATFEENALKKARMVAEYSVYVTLADAEPLSGSV